MTGIEFEGAAIVFGGALKIGPFLGLQRRRQQVVIAGIIGLMTQRRREVPARVLVFAAFEVKLGQTGLRFLGGLGWQKTETRQACEDRYGFAMTAGVLVTPSHGENVIDKIQVWHHGAASMQLREGCPANAYDNRLTRPSKMKQDQGKPEDSERLREFGKMGSAPVPA